MPSSVSGLRRAVALIVSRVRSMLYGRERLIVLVKQLQEAGEDRARGAQLQLQELGPQHLPALARLNRKRRRPWVNRRFASYVRQGFHGFVGFEADELVAYYWWVDAAAQHRFPDLRRLGLEIELGAGEVYGSDFFVLEGHRGKGRAAQFLSSLEAELRRRGYRRLWGYVLSDNRPARWLYSVRGYEPMWIIDRRVLLFAARSRRMPVTEGGKP